MLPRKQTLSQLAHVLCNNAIMQITYRSMDRTLTDVEVDAMQVGQFKQHVSSPWLPACIPDGSPPAGGSQLGPGAALSMGVLKKNFEVLFGFFLKTSEHPSQTG